MSYEYDMAVIGAGAAGLTAAGMSALLGAKTVLIEEQRLGGDCTWTGCIPSKTLLHASRAAQQMKTAGRLGFTATQPQFDFLKVMDHVRQIRQHIYDDSDAPPRMEKLGVEAAGAHWNAFAPPADQCQLSWVILRHEIDYKRAAYLAQEIVVKTWVGAATHFKFERHTEMLRAADGALLARARTIWCALDADTGKPAMVSDELRARFSVSPASH